MRTLIALLLTLLLTGCGAASMTMVTGSPPPAASAPEPEAAETVRYTVELVEWSDEARTEDGTTLASYTFQLPVLTAVRADGTPITEAWSEPEEQAISAAAAFNEKFGKWAAAEEFPEFVASAGEDLGLRRECDVQWTPYELTLDCTVYQTDRIISVAGLYYTYTSGAHPNTWQLSWNFDLEQGAFFGPELLADNTELQEAVSGEIIRQAKEPLEDGTVPAEWYWEDYEAIIANWASYTVNFDEEGMVVIFSPYELAPYAAGLQTFRLSYNWLEPHLSAHGRALLGLEAE